MKRLLSCKTCILVLSMAFFSVIATAQNLVPNGGFEEGVTCPTWVGNVTEECANWFGSIIASPDSTPSPDWFHECSEFDAFTPPTVAFGTIMPAEGMGYAGIIGYRPNNPNYREIIGVQLAEYLVVGEEYLVEFKYSNIVPSNSAVTSSSLGFQFSTNSSFPLSTFPPNQSHYFVDSLIPADAMWKQVTQLFIADSAYNYIHIGNFFDDLNTETFPESPNSGMSHYTIDDVSVTEVGITNGLDSETNPYLKIYPNPSADEINIILANQENIQSISIIGNNGQLVERVSSKSTNQSKRINIRHLSNGFYVLQIVTSKSIYYDKFIKF